MQGWGGGEVFWILSIVKAVAVIRSLNFHHSKQEKSRQLTSLTVSNARLLSISITAVLALISIFVPIPSHSLNFVIFLAERRRRRRKVK